MKFVSFIFCATIAFVVNNNAIENYTTNFGNYHSIIEEADQYDGSGPLPDFAKSALQNKVLNICVENTCTTNARMLAIPNFLYCSACQVLVSKGIFLRRTLGFSQSTISSYFANLCKVAGISLSRVCEGVMNINIPIFVYMVDNDKAITSKIVCGRIFQENNCFTTEKKNYCPEIILPDEHQHIDDLYLPGGNSECGEPQCCQKDQELPKTTANTCGFWSDYKASDCPWHLVDETMNHLNNTHLSPSWIYYTGDVLSHRVWETDKNNLKNTLLKYYETLKDTFTGINVYPVLGNHDSSPLDQFTPLDVADEFNSRWLYEFIAETWIDKLGWLPKRSKETIRKGGYYAVNPTPGLKIIALNSNVAYIYNWWLSYKDYECDPYEQLKWLVNEVDEAEIKGETVHILGHVPTGDKETLHSWSNKYNKIIERYRKTVVLQLVGHTHYNQFYVQFSSNNSSEPINFQMNGGSLTPFVKTNPSYQVYTINSETFVPRDIVQYDFDLAQANLNYKNNVSKTLQWTKRIPYSELYGLEEVSPKELGNLLERMIYDRKLFNEYHSNKPAHAEIFLQEGCDNECLQNFLCETCTTDSSNNYKCEEIVNKLLRN